MNHNTPKQNDIKKTWLQNRGYRKIKIHDFMAWVLSVKRSGVSLTNTLPCELVEKMSLEEVQASYYHFAATFKREVEKINGKWGVE